MGVISFICTVIAIGALYAIKRSVGIGPHLHQAAKFIGWGLVSVALLICLFEYGFWKGLFFQIAMLMIVAIAMPFLFSQHRSAPELR